MALDFPCGQEFIDGKYAVIADLGDLHAGVGRGAAGLVPPEVTFTGCDDVVAWSRQRANRNLVGHGAAGKEERRFLAEDRGDLFLQQVGRRILAVLIVAYRRTGNRVAHRLRGSRDGVRAQVDGASRIGAHGSNGSGIDGSSASKFNVINRSWMFLRLQVW